MEGIDGGSLGQKKEVDPWGPKLPVALLAHDVHMQSLKFHSGTQWHEGEPRIGPWAQGTCRVSFHPGIGSHCVTVLAAVDT